MLILLFFLVAIFSVIYFKFIIPYYYWYHHDIFYVTPWSRFKKIFLNKKSFAELVCDAYNEYPDRRYYGSYQFLSPSLFVRDLDLIKRITVKDFEHFTDHSSVVNEKTDPLLSLNLFSLKGQKWREMRSTLSPVFTGSKMRAMYTLIEETARDFTKHFLHKSDADSVTVVQIKDIFSKYTNDVIANCAFGIKCNSLLEENNEFYSMGSYIASPTPLRVIGGILFGIFPKVFEILGIPALPNRISSYFIHLITDAIKTREQNDIYRPDLIHLLMEARKGRLQDDKTDLEKDTGFATAQETNNEKTQHYAIKLTDEVVTAQALVFFIAGFTTSSSVMSFLAYELAIAPDIQSKLQSEIDQISKSNNTILYEDILNMRYLDQVVTEVLRKYPPGYVLNRICVKDYVIKAEKPNEKTVTIQKGCLIAIPVMAIHYDPNYFPNPEKFDPERFNDENKLKIGSGTYMPFGIGPRNCIGSRFALLEIKVLLVNLLSTFNIVPVERTVIPLQLAKSLGLDAKGGIWLGLQKRPD